MSKPEYNYRNMLKTREELFALSEDRVLVTKELHQSNDYYGHASIIKKYVGLSNDYVIKAAIEHGMMWQDFIWEVDLNAPFPTIIVYGPGRYQAYRKFPSRVIIPIGPYIAYSPHYLDKQTLEKEKKRLGKMLLAFPLASTHYIEFNYDIKAYCKELEDMSKDFDSIGICLYWKDILTGKGDIFLKYGFECFTAGHMFDPLFLSRLKSIIELSTVTTSNHVGTYLGYSVYMGRPFWLTNPGEVNISKPINIIDDETPMSWSAFPQFSKPFSARHGDISVNQMEVVDRYWGLSNIKSVEEMEKIIKEAEESYKRKKIVDGIFKPIRMVANIVRKLIKSYI